MIKKKIIKNIKKWIKKKNNKKYLNYKKNIYFSHNYKKTIHKLIKIK